MTEIDHFNFHDIAITFQQSLLCHNSAPLFMLPEKRKFVVDELQEQLERGQVAGRAEMQAI